MKRGNFMLKKSENIENTMSNTDNKNKAHTHTHTFIDTHSEMEAVKLQQITAKNNNNK